jgi:hypothetical protein
MRWNLWIGLAVACGAGGVAGADEEVVLPAAKDNTLYEREFGDLSNGAGEYVFAGLSAGGEVRRGLIAFDIAGGVPAGSAITAVTLELEMSRTIVGAQPISLHRVLADWGEGASDAEKEEGEGADAQPGDATWVHTFFDTLEWGMDGGDFEPGASGEQTVDGPGPYTWGSTDAMVVDVQSWLDEPKANFGWLLRGPEEENSAKRFNTRENAAEATRPRLRVRFDPPCYADFDASGTLDLFDFLAFVNAYNAGEPRANCDGDEGYSLFDFLCFVNAFNQGC